MNKIHPLFEKLLGSTLVNQSAFGYGREWVAAGKPVLAEEPGGSARWYGHDHAIYACCVNAFKEKQDTIAAQDARIKELGHQLEASWANARVATSIMNSKDARIKELDITLQMTHGMDYKQTFRALADKDARIKELESIAVHNETVEIKSLRIFNAQLSDMNDKNVARIKELEAQLSLARSYSVTYVEDKSTGQLEFLTPAQALARKDARIKELEQKLSSRSYMDPDTYQYNEVWNKAIDKAVNVVLFGRYTSYDGPSIFDFQKILEAASVLVGKLKK